jgi:hypothetical protein
MSSFGNKQTHDQGQTTEVLKQVVCQATCNGVMFTYYPLEPCFEHATRIQSKPDLAGPSD